MSYPPSRPRRARWAVAVAAALTLTAAVMLVVAAHRRAPASATRSVGDARPDPGQAQSSSSTAPHTAERLRQPFVTAAELAGLRWADFYGVELPVSPSAGPFHSRGGLAWGFARTPLGALLAAVNIAVRANAQWGPRIFTSTIRRQVTGPAASNLLAACQSTYDSERPVAGVRPGQPLGRAYVSEEAFRWVSYSPAAATVDVVSAGPGPQGTTVRAATQIQLTWSHGDWRVIAPAGGDWGNSAAPLTSLRGYTVFPIPNP